MGSQWVVAIGINQYRYLQSLSYARQDAQAMRNFWVNEARVPPYQCLLFTDNAPLDGTGVAAEATAIQEALERLCQEQLLPDDQLWVFVSAYGLTREQLDYLLPLDGNPLEPVETSLPMSWFLNCIHKAHTKRVLLFLDIKRFTGGDPDSLFGPQTIALAQSLGIPMILSCTPDQFSSESLALGHGLFTEVLLEGLRLPQGDTVAGLVQYLNDRLPVLSQRLGYPIQTPLAILPSPEVLTLPLLLNRKVTVGLGHSLEEDSLETLRQRLEETLHRSLPSSSFLSSVPMTPSNPQSSPTDSQDDDSHVDIPDPIFWRQALGWGMGIVIFLLMSILIRNWKQLTTVPPKPLPTASSALVQGQGMPDQLALNTAHLALKSNQVSAYSDAIASARRIPAHSPLYPEAQARIHRWYQAILDIAEGRALDDRYVQALEAAQLIPQTQTDLYPKAQQLMGQWSDKAEQQRVNGAKIDAAKALVRPGSASSYSEAIEVLRQIPKDQPLAKQANQLRDEWSQEILKIAEERAAMGRYRRAIEAASLVPEDSSSYGAAQKAIKDWQ